MRHLFLLLLLPFSLLCGGCISTTPTQVSEEERSRWAQPVKQDANLYRIDSKLFRSEQPIDEDAALIEELGIKSIVNLRYFDRNDNHTAFSGRNIALFNQPLLTWRIKPEHIAATLFLIERQQQHGAVLVHCYHGADRTGLISAMYRVIYQNWSIDRAKREMQQGPFGYHSIWKNIDRLLNEKTVAEVRSHLQTLRNNAR